MSQKIKCPHCKEEFLMEEGLISHLKTLEDDTRKKVEQDLKGENKKNVEKLKELKEENQKKDEKINNFQNQKKSEIDKAIKEALAADREKFDADNKKHYASLFGTKMKDFQENTNQKHSEERQVWILKENRMNKKIDDLLKTGRQGSNVDQGSGPEMQLGEFLKKIFKNYKDKINEYEKGVAGGDWLQEVIENDISICKILYERKNTKGWSNGWIEKMQEDMKDSKSDIGIIFTQAVPKDFPKHESFTHKGNIFICRYDFIALKNLALTQRYLLTQLNKERKNGKENALSAIKFWDLPSVKNVTHQLINNQSDAKKKLLLTKKNLNDAIEDIDSISTNFDELFSEIKKIGIDAFFKKKKETNKK